MKKRFIVIVLTTAVFGITGCAVTHDIFRDTPPLTQLDDHQPSPIPAQNDFRFVEQAISSSVRYPLIRYLDGRRIPRSEDVNARDNIPASAWYTPRLGYKTISPQELLKGPIQTEPPALPFQVVNVEKDNGKSQLLVKDARGDSYLVQFDPAEFPNLESTVGFVVNRLFWGFGYYVPDVHLLNLGPDQIQVDSHTQASRSEVNNILWSAAADKNGHYRVLARKQIAGIALGPISQKGTRKGDINDRIPHENLRILRALHVFCALTDLSVFQGNHTLDVYQGEAGKGYTVHYLLNFANALGVHGIETESTWNSFEHFFSWKDTAAKAARLGMPVKPWEKLNQKTADSKTYFRSDIFDPRSWKETFQFEPLEISRTDDNYWAAKVIGALNREQLETLFQAVNDPDPAYVNYLVDTLMKRREKILSYFLYQVSPLESSGLSNGRLLIEDNGKKLLPDAGTIQYQIRFYNRRRHEISEPMLIENQPVQFSIPISGNLLNLANGYLRVEILVFKNGKSVPGPAAFHIRKEPGGTPKLVGIVH